PLRILAESINTGKFLRRIDVWVSEAVARAPSSVAGRPPRRAAFLFCLSQKHGSQIAWQLMFQYLVACGTRHAIRPTWITQRKLSLVTASSFSAEVLPEHTAPRRSKRRLKPRHTRYSSSTAKTTLFFTPS